MRITIGRVAAVLGLLAAAAAIAWTLMPRPVTVEVVAVTKGRFVASVDEDGTVGQPVVQIARLEAAQRGAIRHHDSRFLSTRFQERPPSPSGASRWIARLW